MNVIIPKDIEFGTLEESNIAADTPTAEYAGGTTYAAGDIVKVSTASDGITQIPVMRYESLQAGNVGNYPPDNSDPTSSDSAWKCLGGTNRWKWADSYLNTQTAADGTEATDAGKIVMTLDAGRCDTVAVFGCTGTKITFELSNPTEGVIDTTEVDLPTAEVEGTWWDYFFAEITYDHDVIHSFPIYHVGSLEVTIEHAVSGLYPACGYIVLGQSVDIGTTEFGAKTGAADYSKKSTDEDGRVYLAVGASAKYMDIDLSIDNADYDRVQSILTGLRGRATVFLANNAGIDYDALKILGFVADFGLVLKGPVHSACELEIKGLT